MAAIAAIVLWAWSVTTKNVEQVLPKTIIALPAYNEAERLPVQDYIDFAREAKSRNVQLLFVNGSLYEFFDTVIYLYKNTSLLARMCTQYVRYGRWEH